MAEQNISERVRIGKALENHSGSQKDQFLKHPMTTRMIISHIKEDNHFDISKIFNTAELFMMLIIKNLYHQNSDTQTFTELTKENKANLQNCFKICMHNIQNWNGVSAIEGDQVLDDKDEKCFETHVLDETIQVSVTLIDKLGMFEYSVVDYMYITRLEWLHLSIGECLAAASLCRQGVEIFKELNKIVDDDRYNFLLWVPQ